jgi:hypothetical protein
MVAQCDAFAMFVGRLMLMLGLFAAPTSETVVEKRYVPSTGWASGDAALYERWFGRQLRAMREPTLRGPRSLAGNRRRFRLLVLPSFSPAYAYRVDEDARGRHILTWVMLDGAGGYAPGRVAGRESRPLSASEAEGLQRAIDNARLADLPRQHVTGSDGDDIIVCADGTQYVLELLGPTETVFLTRHRCELDGLAGLEHLLAVTFRLHPVSEP